MRLEVSAYQATLLTACTLVGGESKLAQRFGVPVEMVLNWTGGVSPVPTVVFLSAADIVREHDGRAYFGAEDYLAEMQRRRPN